MKQRVKALIGGQTRRNRGHQFGIDNRENGECLVVAAADLFICLCFCDNGPWICLGTRTGRRCNRDDRQGIVRHRQALAAAAVYIIPVVAAVGGHNGNGLGGIDCAAAPQPDDKITARCFCERGALHDMFLNWVRQDFVK